jgi:hypothetical protein
MWNWPRSLYSQGWGLQARRLVEQLDDVVHDRHVAEILEAVWAQRNRAHRPVENEPRLRVADDAPVGFAEFLAAHVTGLAGR